MPSNPGSRAARPAKPRLPLWLALRGCGVGGWGRFGWPRNNGPAQPTSGAALTRDCRTCIRVSPRAGRREAAHTQVDALMCKSARAQEVQPLGTSKGNVHCQAPVNYALPVPTPTERVRDVLEIL